MNPTTALSSVPFVHRLETAAREAGDGSGFDITPLTRRDRLCIENDVRVGNSVLEVASRHPQVPVLACRHYFHVGVGFLTPSTKPPESRPPKGQHASNPAERLKVLKETLEALRNQLSWADIARLRSQPLGARPMLVTEAVIPRAPRASELQGAMRQLYFEHLGVALCRLGEASLLGSIVHELPRDFRHMVPGANEG